MTLAKRNWASRLRRFIEQPPAERCEFCSAPLAAAHSHLIDLASRKIVCACAECEARQNGSGRFRLISPRCQALDGFAMSEAQWDALQIPIELVFMFQSSVARRPVAIYPGPAGPMESALTLGAWSELVAENPALADMRPDVEALLVNRTRGARDFFLVSIDRCYALVGLMRTHWRGLAGGAEAWGAIEGYLAALAESAARELQGSERRAVHG